jgi:hypothetical protein
LKELARNYYIFVSKEENWRICMKHLIYAANIARPEHRALCNVKKGDIVFIYNMSTRTLYGPFVAEGRVFENTQDLGWDKRWPHNVPLQPWRTRIGVLDKYDIQRVYREIKRELKTIRDIDDLHRRYLNSLLRSEGEILLEKFLEEAKFMKPKDVYSEFGTSPIRGTPVSVQLSNRSKEYQVELYLLQHLEKLEEIVGRDITEVYNQIYVHQSRFLDILTFHKIGNKILRATVVEIKAKSEVGDIEKGLEELGHYISTLIDWIGDAKKVSGILLTPKASTQAEKAWDSYSREISSLYDIDSKRLEWIQYEIRDGELTFL